MLVKIELKFGLKNGSTKVVEVGEKDPKGLLKDTTTGEEREINLTDKDVLMEYTKRISVSMDEGKTLFFRGLNEALFIFNPNEVASIELNIVGGDK